MGLLRLRRVDDAVRSYWAHHDGTCIGEIRGRAWGTSELHTAGGRYLLRRDDTAEVLGRRAGFARAVLRMVTFGARYSLREGDRVLARVERRFRLSTRRDGLRLHLHAMPDLRITCPGGAMRHWSIDAGDASIGHVAMCDGGREVAWHGPALLVPVTLFALYAFHQQFGTSPFSTADGGDGGD